LLPGSMCELDHTEDMGFQVGIGVLPVPIAQDELNEGKGGDIWVGGLRLVTKAGRIA
jgi:hypothetical protein